VIVPWTLYKMYGDTAILHRHVAAITGWRTRRWTAACGWST